PVSALLYTTIGADNPSVVLGDLAVGQFTTLATTETASPQLADAAQLLLAVLAADSEVVTLVDVGAAPVTLTTVPVASDATPVTVADVGRVVTAVLASDTFAIDGVNTGTVPFGPTSIIAAADTFRVYLGSTLPPAFLSSSDTVAVGIG